MDCQDKPPSTVLIIFVSNKSQKNDNPFFSKQPAGKEYVLLSFVIMEIVVLWEFEPTK